MQWQSSGGADGGGFLRVAYPAGGAHGGAYWWRPFNPLNAPGNGRATADPGAGGSIAPATWSVSSGSDTTNGWSAAASNPGWYMHATHQASNPGKFQGSDFYIQYRIRRASRPGAPPDNAQYSNITGKSAWITNTNYTYTTQEFVFFGQSQGNGDQPGVFERQNIYDGQNFDTLPNQPDRTVNISNLTVGWRYSGAWDTLMMHITPGTNGGTGANRTRVEVWAQHDLTLFPAEAGVFVKIWDVTFSQSFETGTSPPELPGWNALILAAYHNGAVFNTSFSFDYDQVIFSKAIIPAPTN